MGSIILSRRWFLLGSAASIVATKLNLDATNIPDLTSDSIIDVPIHQSFKTNTEFNEIVEINISNEIFYPNEYIIKAEFNGPAYLRLGTSPYGCAVYFAAPDQGLFIHKDKPLVIEAARDPGPDSKMYIINRNNGNPFYEWFEWVNGEFKLVRKMFMNIQNYVSA